MNRAFAEQIQHHALQAIEHFSHILQSPELQHCSPELQARLHRSIATLIGETQVTVLDEIVPFFPELDDLK